MPDRSRRLPIACPKCQSTNTTRTGAYTLESTASQRDTDSVRTKHGNSLVVYDRICTACGRHFTEAVEQHAS